MGNRIMAMPFAHRGAGKRLQAANSESNDDDDDEDEKRDPDNERAIVCCCWLIFGMMELLFRKEIHPTNNAIAIFLNNHFSGVCHSHHMMANGSAHHKNRLSLDDTANNM